MKIKISKSQWETIGNKHGWRKTSQVDPNQQRKSENPQFVQSVVNSHLQYLNSVAEELTQVYDMNQVPLTQEIIQQVQQAVQRIAEKASTLQPTA